jgi:hypothetical protein
MHRCLLLAAFFAVTLTLAAASEDGPKNAVVLIIRHAEDADKGRGLSVRGNERAEAYQDYFQHFTVDSKRLEPTAIFAATDSKRSHRPRLTVEPFATVTRTQIDTRFGNNESTELATNLRATQQGKIILICWRHGNIPALLHALGVRPKNFLPHGKWPDRVYDWVILLSYDQNGHLIPGSSRRINEHLMTGDSN